MSVVSAISAFARAEAAAAAHRLAAIHALMELRVCDDDERALWACDTWDACAAEIGAALGISGRKAFGQMHFALAMHVRLPRVFGLLRAGVISARTASIISWRTRMVIDDYANAAIDAEIATRAERWGALSEARLDVEIDKVLAEHDPDAVAAFEAAARGRDVQFGKPEDETGTCSMWGRIYSTDAALIRKRVAQLTRHLCGDDPRTAGERRSDALGAMAAESGPLACRCGKPECVGATVKPSRSPAVIHVLADERAVAAARAGIPKETRQTSQNSSECVTVPDPAARAAGASAQDPSASPAATPTSARRPAAVLQGGGIVPQPLLRELLLSGAAVKPLTPPPQTPEPGYHPSAALAAFVRTRDMFCRFPGCSTPAQFCHIDHAIPYPVGPTHPSDLRCLCRKNHLLKTFYVGEGGWSDVQHPDGSITWTAPTGHTYTTHPGSRIVFPDWDTTAPLPNLAPSSTPSLDKGVQMPRRRRTREEDRLQRIKSRRAKRDTS
ncbi:DUF222 domain-containing protein [Mycobacterium sp. ACS4331]|uniref:HNH endonuclease signature motif containing protein n=1 Tax=Mycobacterium sp. ACS4331 TaxID=1834121 RepID=UPI000AD9B182